MNLASQAVQRIDSRGLNLNEQALLDGRLTAEIGVGAEVVGIGPARTRIDQARCKDHLALWIARGPVGQLASVGRPGS